MTKRRDEPARRPKGSGTIEERPNGQFRAKIWVAGERRQETFPKRSAANNWLEVQLAERVARVDGTISTKGFRPGLKLKDLRKEFLEDLEQNGRTKQTRRGYRSHVD